MRSPCCKAETHPAQPVLTEISLVTFTRNYKHKRRFPYVHSSYVVMSPNTRTSEGQSRACLL